MKVKNLLYSILVFCILFSFSNLNAQNSKQSPTYIQGPPQRTCGTEMPSQQWEELFQKQIEAFLAANPELNSNAKQGGGNSTQAVYTIPVIIHVIHGGQSPGTFPNLAQGQLNSQIQVLNDDFAGVGYNIGNYPANAFTAWATNTTIAAASKDALGRIKIANTGVTFCLALKDSLGNILPEPGIDRVDYNSITAPLTGTFTSKNPAAAVYNTPGKFQGFINGYIKPNTIWNLSKYMNLWVTDEQAAVGLLGYATFPPLSTLTGIPGSLGTSTTDGFWAWAAAFGSKVIFPGGTYSTGYDLGRTCTHEIGHWVGLRHIWGDGACLTDYCNDTPPASASNFNNCPVTYPLKSGSCAGPPSNSPNGEMFMNFMDYTFDCAMFMFTEDQRTRIQTAMANSPYRKFLGTHGLCSVPPPVANFSFSPNPACVGQTVSIVDMSTGSPGAWSYTMTGGAPSTSTLQSPFVTYAAAGVYSITLVASNGGGSSTPVVKTITINAAPVLTVTPVTSTICAGGSTTLTASGATTYTWMPGSLLGATIAVTPTITTTYTVTGANGSCTNTKTVSVVVSGSPTVNIAPASATVCSGNSTVLTGSGATSYTWMPGSITTASVSVSPTITTTYTLTGSNGGACVNTKTVQVTVNTTPTVNVVASPTAVCAGSNATITASGATTYSWNTGATTAAIIVTPTIATNYTVTGTNGTCSNTKTISITVNASPTLNINPPSATVCVGSSATFFGSGAVNYTWMPGGVTNASISVTPTITTTYTLTGTNAGGCASTKTTQVVVNALPTVTVTGNPASICPGSTSTITASASGPGPFTYSWSTGATAASITTSIVGVYTATVTNGNGCKGTQTFSLNAAAGLTITATATPTSVCSGGSTTITATGASTYTWNTGPTTASIVVSPTIATTYTVNGTSGSCIGSKTITVAVNANPTVAVAASPTLVCAGNAATLTASGATTYSWSTGATTTVVAVTPTTTTTYTVTGYNTFGCSNTKTVSVSTIAAPSISIAATPTGICSGGNATLTASGASTYTWNTGPTTAVIVVTPTLTTTYTVIGSNGTCANTKTISLTVNSNPTVAVISTPTAICAGGTASLVASGATTYSWNTGATTSAIGVTPTITTTYTVTGNNGTCSNTKTISLIVNPNPTIAVAATPTAICAGGTTSLIATGASTYSWSTGATTSAIGVNPTITTTYTVTGFNAGGCSNTKTISVTVNNGPSITAFSSSSVICVGQSAILTASSSATSYTWSTGSNSTSISVSPTITTSYTISGTNPAGCIGSTVITQSVSPCTGITTITNPSANYGAYPNPNNGEFIVTVEKLTENTFVEIYNTIGQLVSKQVLKDYSTKINLSEQADGVYYVLITKESKHLFKTKVIKN